MNWGRFYTNFSVQRITMISRQFGALTALIATAYVAASTSSAIMISFLMPDTVKVPGTVDKKTAVASITNFSGPSRNYHSVEKAIKERNLFNSAGNFPEETSAKGSAGGETKVSNFDIKAPCQKATINVSLVGTIYLGANASLATLQEQGYSESDVYREGDAIVNDEGASIAKIERNKVIINNKGAKECLELLVLPPKNGNTATSSISPGGPPGGGIAGPGELPPAAGNDCALEEKYVQDELGPGFGTIIQKARLVPNTVDNQMNGFKIFAIDQQSLLARTGLQNGDIITQVNETSLKQPEQGFALYQAFQDEREVRIHILRGGTTPMMITCRIK